MRFKSTSLPKVSRALVLGILAAGLVVPLTTAQDFTAHAAGCALSGSGADNDPYLVTSSADLWNVLDCQGGSSGVVFSLTQNIDFASANTNSPIGSRCDMSPNDAVPFKGVLRGNLKTLSNLAFSSSDCGVGLFGALDGAVVENLFLTGTLSTTKNSTDYDLSSAGSLAVLVRRSSEPTTISNVSVLTSVSGNSAANVGGLVGVVDTLGSLHIADSVVSGTVFGGFSGGFVGTVLYGGQLSIFGSTNSANISGFNAAGMVAKYVPASPPLEIQDSANGGDVTSTGGTNGMAGGAVALQTGQATYFRFENSGSIQAHFAAGVVAKQDSSATYSHVVNKGPVSSTGLAGGIVGKAQGAVHLVSSMNHGTVSSLATVAIQNSGRYVGGMVGYLDTANSLISSSGNTGVVSASSEVGGLVGYAGYSNGQLTVYNSSNSGQVSGSGLDDQGDIIGGNKVGGLVGHSEDGLLRLQDSSNHETVHGIERIGGLIGHAQNSHVTISRSANHATVSGTSVSIGGFVGRYSGGVDHADLAISDSSNHAIVTGDESVGGLVGNIVDDDAPLGVSIVRTSNYGDIEASTSYSGGFLGSGNEDVILEIRESFNVGNVSGDYSGGFFGIHDGDYNLADVFNQGRISGEDSSGFGWDGNSGSNGQLQHGYSTGRFGSAPSDGLIAGYPSSTVVSLSFTATDSTLVSTSTEAELKVISTFVGWDFDTVWGFGPCTLNGGFPVLRWAHPGETFYFYSCGENSQPVQNNQVPGSSGAPTPIAPVYMGPILDGGMISVSRLEQVEIAGSRLLSILAAEIDGFSVEILSLSSSSMTINIPSSVSDGVHDLVVLSRYGTLTVQRKLQIIQPLAPESFGELLGFRFSQKFQGNSRSLSGLQEAGVDRSLGEFAKATTIVCWGYTTSVNPKDWAIAHATARANSVCAQAQTVRGDVKYYIRVRFGVPMDAAMRASMQFWTSEKSN